MMLEYPKFDTTDCRINATYDRIMARRQADAECATDSAWQYGRLTPLQSRGGVFLWPQWPLWTTLTLVAVAMIAWRWVL